jgi:hypothetical protein
MFWKRQDGKEKLSRPIAIPALVRKHLTAERKMDPDLVQLLMAVVRESANRRDIRIFDKSEAEAKKVLVKDYTTFDEHPDLIIYEGSFADDSKRVELNEMKKIITDTPIFTEAEIQQKIEGLSEPGSTIFFYTARGPKYGGPLGMGAAVIELNASYPDKGNKKYIIYTADVVDMQPVGKGDKLFDTNKSKDIASWIKQAHQKRMY